MAKDTDAETEQIKRLLPAATEKQVKAFVKKLAQKDPSFRRELCAWLEKQFVPKGGDSEEALQKMVRRMFRATPKERPSSPWAEVLEMDWTSLAERGGLLMDSAAEMMARGQSAAAATLALAFAEQMAAHIAKGYLVDEVEYDLPDVVERVGEILEQAIELPDVPTEEKQKWLPRLEALVPYAQDDGLDTLPVQKLMNNLRKALPPEQEGAPAADSPSRHK